MTQEAKSDVKHDVLRSIAHNIAASLAGGVGLLVGAYNFDIFRDAANSPEGYICVDFLSGATTGGQPSLQVANIVRAYHDALAALCEKHGVSRTDFVTLTARYWRVPTAALFSVTVEDRMNRRSTTEYAAPDGHRVKVVDGEGRVRPKPVRRS